MAWQNGKKKFNLFKIKEIKRTGINKAVVIARQPGLFPMALTFRLQILLQDPCFPLKQQAR